MGWAGPPSPEAFCGQGVRDWYHRDCQWWDSQNVEFREKQVGCALWCFLPAPGTLLLGWCSLECRDGRRITILVFKSHHKH